MKTTYIFYRNDGFYPIEFETILDGKTSDEYAIENALKNTGTIKVEKLEYLDPTPITIWHCNNNINKYIEVCQLLKQDFEKKYFLDPEEDEYLPDSWWVAGRIGDILHINDYYFDINSIRIALEFDISSDQLFNWYEIITTRNPNISLLYYLTNESTIMEDNILDDDSYREYGNNETDIIDYYNDEHEEVTED